jgi:ABC-2 type transport system ATP-binding protein
MSDAIVLENVTKTFGSKVAVNALNLEVPIGGLYGFIGPNGAGKTSTIRLVMSILFPDSGRVSVLGEASALAAKDRIGYLPEERGLYRKMKVGAFLVYMGRLKGVDETLLRDRVRHWLERVGLADVETKRCEELSKGMQQKVQFVAAVIHEPELLILDEPFTGLDPVNMRLLRELVLDQHARGATVLFSTHVMPQAEQICEHIVMIHEGEKVLDDSLDAVRVRYDPRRVVLEPLDPPADVIALENVVGVDAVAATARGFAIALEDDADVSRTLGGIVAAAPPRHLELERPSLEEVFLTLVAEKTQ